MLEKRTTCKRSKQEGRLRNDRLPDPGRFEEWLAWQDERGDGVGRVARFVLADIERGCWWKAGSAPGFMALYYNKAWVGRSKRYCIEHLQSHHGADARNVAIFSKAWAEYLAARWEYVNQAPAPRLADAEHPANFA